jgi:hypothetical protein
MSAWPTLPSGRLYSVDNALSIKRMGIFGGVRPSSAGVLGSLGYANNCHGKRIDLCTMTNVSNMIV